MGFGGYAGADPKAGFQVQIHHSKGLNPRWPGKALATFGLYFLPPYP
jgi:hypothetical protein